MPHSETEYTRGEVAALVAPVLKIAVEDIDNVIIISVGRCNECGERNGIGMVETIRDPAALIDLLDMCITHVMEGHMS